MKITYRTQPTEDNKIRLHYIKWDAVKSDGTPRRACSSHFTNEAKAKALYQEKEKAGLNPEMVIDHCAGFAF